MRRLKKISIPQGTLPASSVVRGVGPGYPAHSQVFLKDAGKKGVSAVAQWVKNPTAAAWVTAEVWVPSQAQRNGLKIWHCHRSGPGTFMCLGCGHKLKKEEGEGKKRDLPSRKAITESWTLI